jgi:membrane-bound lytic murein transglycosylase MltF
MLDAGLVRIVIVDGPVAKFWSQIYPKLHPDVAVSKGGHTAWMNRKESPRFKAVVNECLAKFPEGSRERNVIFHEYLKSAEWVKSATSEKEIRKFRRTIDLFRKYGDQYDMDYLLMMTRSYEESQLGQAAGATWERSASCR